VVGRPKSTAWSVRPDQLRRALVVLVMGRRSKRLRVRVQTVRLMKRVWLTSVATVLIIGAGISAYAALRALSARNVAND
jgi:hypothetical protein